MPLKVNVGLTKKIGEASYGSRGASVNVELELDGSLAQDPAKLHEKIGQLFSLVRKSLAEELNGGVNGQAHAANGGGNGNGNGNGNGASQTPTPAQKPRGATQSQAKAIFAITKNQRINMKQLLRERFKVDRPEDLTIKEASQLIDELKSSQSQEGA